MLKVGITGGIGSGKTTVCQVFEFLGIPVYYADDRAKWLMNNDPKLTEGVKKLFGKEAYTDEGQLNRKYIAAIVFKDKEKLAKLNQLVHPAVWKDGEDWNKAQKNVPYTLKEAALIFESGGHLQLDQVITVFAPKELRIERVLKRDQTTKGAIEERMSKQMSEEEKINRADFVIFNDGSQSLIHQVMEIHQKLIEIK